MRPLPVEPRHRRADAGRSAAIAVVEAQAALPADEGEVAAELEREGFQLLDQSRVELTFRVLFLEV